MAKNIEIQINTGSNTYEVLYPKTLGSLVSGSVGSADSAISANSASTLSSVLEVGKGGTGVSTLDALKTVLNILNIKIEYGERIGTGGTTGISSRYLIQNTFTKIYFIYAVKLGYYNYMYLSYVQSTTNTTKYVPEMIQGTIGGCTFGQTDISRVQITSPTKSGQSELKIVLSSRKYYIQIDDQGNYEDTSDRYWNSTSTTVAYLIIGI